MFDTILLTAWVFLYNIWYKFSRRSYFAILPVEHLVLTVEATEPSDFLRCIYLCVCHRVVIYKFHTQGSVTVMHSFHKWRYLLSLQSRPFNSKLIRLRHPPFKTCKQNYIPNILESLCQLWGLCIIMALPQVTVYLSLLRNGQTYRYTQ
jgi:hypothetical protein